jgi:AcrR family transcriptional regulator
MGIASGANIGATTVDEEPRTERGRKTRNRIVKCAAEMMLRRGVAATTVDDVVFGANAGKGQFYHYFKSKDALVAAVVAHQLAVVLGQQKCFDLSTLDGLQAWLEVLVREQEKEHCATGCPLGSIVADVVDTDDRLRTVAALAFERWETELASALAGMQERGEIAAGANARWLAQAALATLQGGYLLSVTRRDLEPLRTAARAAFELIIVHAPDVTV